MQTDLTIINKWSFMQKILFRFFAFLLFISIFPFPIGYLPLTHTLSGWYHTLFNSLISFTGKHLFHIKFPLAPTTNGSGDTTYNYVQLFLFVALTVIVTITWSVADLKRKNYELLLYLLIIYLRYYLGFTMIYYGLEKLIKTQFAFPYNSLNETYGQSSPMRLLWNFMGYSTAYNVFIGLSQIVGGFLLFFRKSTTLGALICIMVLSNVVMVNFCFDVPVKLQSVNLLFVAIFIAIPDAKRLIDFFLRNKAVPAADLKSKFTEHWMKIILGGIKFMLITYIIYSTLTRVLTKYSIQGDGAFKKTPLFGIYTVEKFKNYNDTSQLFNAAAEQWKTLNVIFPKKASIKMMNGNTQARNFFTDTVNKKIQISIPNDSTYKSTFSYFIPDSAHLILSGRVKDDSVYIFLRKQDLNEYPLINRGFHWINEFPYK